MRESLDKMFQDELARLEPYIKKMEDANILPVRVRNASCGWDEWDAKKLREKLAEFGKEQFTIAVSGPVKVGKSTFINSLLFGEDILPTLPTPCTAKLTFITHTDGNPYAEVSFYTKKEFDVLNEELKKSSVAEDFEQQKKNSMENYGILPNSSEGANGRKVQLKCLSVDELCGKLEPYVSENGKFTPFVNKVYLYINCPELSNILLVDTPGLDDPNPLNTNATIGWINNADAMIYLMSVRGIDASGQEFLKTISGGAGEKKSARNRMFVISQTDSEPERWKDTQLDFKKNFPVERIFGYSAKIKMLEEKKEKGELLDPRDDRKLARLAKLDFQSDPSDVHKKVQELLFNEEGKIKINNLTDKLLACCNYSISVSSEKVKELDHIIEISSQSLDEIVRDLKKIEKLRSSLQEKSEAAIRKAQGKLAECSQDRIFTEINPIVERMRHEIDTRIDGPGYQSDRLMRESFGPDVEYVVKKHRAEIGRTLQDFLSDYNTSANTLKREFIRILQEGGCEDILSEPSDEKIRNLIYEISERVKNTADLSYGQLYKETNFFWHSNQTNRQTMKNKAKTIFNGIQGQVEDLTRSYDSALRKEISDYGASFEEKVENEYSLRREQVSMKQEGRTSEKERAEKERSQLKEKISKAEKIKREL